MALIVGAAFGTYASVPRLPLVVPPIACLVAGIAWRRHLPLPAVVAVTCGFAAAGAILAADARQMALYPPLRTLLDRQIGAFSIDSLGPEADHDPIEVRAVLLEDAAVRDGFVSLRTRVLEVDTGAGFAGTHGHVSITVSGRIASQEAHAWRAGRIIQAPVTFRRPARYLNDGVPDFERQMALDGTTLFASTKSGLAVAVSANGTWVEERAADLRAHVRTAVSQWVGRHDALAAGIVTAVLIGDRTGLPDAIRDRLQAAGTYHVIAISGGNIAILAGLVLGALKLAGVHGRGAALITVAVLIAYAQVATAGPSVWRATLMAVLYLGARLLDHRSGAWQAAAVAAAVLVTVRPLDILDPGFILTFGATAALVEGGRRGQRMLPAHRAAAWVVASLTASLAVELTLLPVSAQLFSRITSAGLVLNLIAVPMMGLAQIAGIVVTLCEGIGVVAVPAGWAAYLAANALVDSARLIDAAPWLTTRVAPPGHAVLGGYYAALVVALLARRAPVRLTAMLLFCVTAALVIGMRPWSGGTAPVSSLRLTMFDVGQGEAILLQSVDGSLHVDAAGAPFGSGSVDVGARLLAPALWARGITRLDALLVTHGDPDHIGGATTLLDDFDVQQLWEGIVVPNHRPTRDLRTRAMARAAAVEQLVAGTQFDWGGVRIRVLHPAPADWERPRVRNDDSVVLEVSVGAVTILLTGDISADVERAIVPHLTPAATRVLKVAHHGSRTSTSETLLQAWRPQFALISAGRGNSFGHPAPEVLRRLESIGARIYRTDRHGQITLETDGADVRVTTFTKS